MNILILGGTGFISGRLAKFLLDTGHRVTIFSRGIQPPPEYLSDYIRFERGDRRVESSLRELVRRDVYDAVYDMIAYEPYDSRLAAQVFRGKVGRFIHCSSTSIYMVSNRVQCPITEDQDKLPIEREPDTSIPWMEYALKKRQCERELWQSHHPQLFPVTILRPTFVSGPGDPTLRDWFWIERILDEKPIPIPGSGDHAMQKVFVDDVAQAFVRALTAQYSAGQAYNVAGEEIYSLNEYLMAVAAILQKNPNLVPVDGDVFDEQPFSRIVGEEVFPFDLRRTVAFSLEKAKHDLGYHPTPLAVWLNRTVLWHVQNVTSNSAGYSGRNDEVSFAQRWSSVKRQMHIANINGGSLLN